MIVMWCDGEAHYYYNDNHIKFINVSLHTLYVKFISIKKKKKKSWTWSSLACSSFSFPTCFKGLKDEIYSVFVMDLIFYWYLKTVRLQRSTTGFHMPLSSYSTTYSLKLLSDRPSRWRAQALLDGSRCYTSPHDHWKLYEILFIPACYGCGLCPPVFRLDKWSQSRKRLLISAYLELSALWYLVYFTLLFIHSFLMS